ncbi:putative OmpL-like beta-barrel porin-2 [Pontibacter ummariensis]|uniref:Putative beta-barrel porin-2, OmpL-like. bbp2 n=1 Tax=Pontibacter ummariensis TaxID=1610492 RepID=A0A239GPY9_9BACT|nr:porin [Pontibacter ummariensis]PRY11367.1 putative OmpL-like beta-barrel porin-2 [Pontibacter ummariensis]SNS70892.1 Putative beta-barrel porin-2, OmpL-like. bbp2 [Pontibacter ummariensis]
MKHLYALLLTLFVYPHTGRAQFLDSLGIEEDEKPFELSGGVDVYYAYDFSEPIGQERLFTTQAFRHNGFNLNWGFLQATYATDKVRATFALQTGTYVQANYAAEPNELTRLIGQANAGVRLAEGVWLDMGILPSHIGYENTFSLNNEIYTRALMAENSPYYETGAQLTAELSDVVTVQFLVLNGWQIIQETNEAKSLGFGISYTPTEALTLSYNNYYGNEAPEGTEAKRRFFHDFYASYAASERFNLAGSVDYGRQELWDSEEQGTWYAAMLLARYRLSERFALAGRVEHYNDEDQLIVSTGTALGFQTSSASLNLDYIPAPNFLWRMEARGYDAQDRVFTGEEGRDDKNLLLVTSFALKF